LIADYNSVDDPCGITPIEDLKIRDMFASRAIIGVQALGEYTYYGQASGISGMWDTSRELLAYEIALCMPDYNTPYYGTSGFGGDSATYTYVPYPSQSATWKDILHDESYPTDIGFPNFAHELGIYGQFLDTPTDRTDQGFGGYVEACPIGTFTNRVPYSDYPAMGNVFQAFSNIIAVSPYTTSRSFSTMDAFYDLCIEDANGNPQLYGMLIDEAEDVDPVRRYYIMLCNDNFDIATDMAISSDTYSTLTTLTNSVFGVVLYDDAYTPEE